MNSGLGSKQRYTKLKELNNQLISIREEELSGSTIRSREDWLDFGEKTNNKPDLNYTKITHRKELLAALTDFYENVYAATEPNIECPNYNTIITPNSLTIKEQ